MRRSSASSRAPATVVGRIERAVRASPTACCLETAAASQNYAGLWDASGRVANLLISLGVRPGDRVAAMTAKSPLAVALYLGCLRAGGVYLPLNPDYRDAEAAYILGDATPAVLIADPARTGGLRDALPQRAVAFSLDAGGHGTLAEALDATSGAEVARSDNDGAAAILYTSGTTGKPKGVVLTHGNLVSNADALVEAWRFTDGDVLIHALPIFHVHGLFVALHCALFAGAATRFLDRFNAGAVIDQLPGATVFMGVPTFYTRLLADPRLDRDICRTMRLFTSGSAPLSPETHRAFEAQTGHAILERYGMTEAGMITSNPYDGDRSPGSVGFPLPGVEVRVVSDDGQKVASGEVGQLEIRGPNVFRGYWQRPDADAVAFCDDGYLDTGDLVRRDPDGRVWIVGRAKDLVITGGMNVYPAEVENALDALDGVAESAVIGVPHTDLGEAVLGVVARQPNTLTLDAESITDALRGSLAGYKRPKAIVLVDALPRNAMGKVQKTELRARFRHHIFAGS